MSAQEQLWNAVDRMLVDAFKQGADDYRLDMLAMRKRFDEACANLFVEEPVKCKFCDGEGRVELNIGGPIVPCPGCLVNLLQQKPTVLVTSDITQRISSATLGTDEIYPEIVQSGRRGVGCEFSLASDANPHAESIRLGTKEDHHG